MWRGLVLMVCLGCCASSRVLVVFPLPSRSHAILGDSVVRILLDAGHEVTYVTPYSSVPRSEGLKSVDISSVAETLADREHLNLMELVRNPRPPHRVLQIGSTFVQRALEHGAVQKLLHDPDLTFDVVVAEWFYTGLLAPLATLYECPLIWYSAIDANWMNLQLVHGQTNPAYSADPQARRTAPRPYSLRERLERVGQQVYLTAWVYYMTYYVEVSAYQNIYRTSLQLRARHLPNYEDVVFNASMMLINSHPLLGQTVPLPQNAKYIGGHHIDVRTVALPKKFQQLLDTSTNGVIFFSLGSNVKSKDLPEHVKRQLLDIFGQLEQTVIWKFEDPLKDLPTNVHIVKWAPQISLLNHTNTILFITHGGFMSYIEATYFGVPIIGVPIFGDQFLTTDLATARGRGIRVDFTDYLPYNIKDAINEILGNYSYRSNTKQASGIFQNAIVSPQRELLYWIELVTNHGTDHLRSPALHMTIFERLHFDIAVLIVLFLWFLSKVVKVIRVHRNSNDDNKKNQ